MSKLPKYKLIEDTDQIIIFFPHSLNIISMKKNAFKETDEGKIIECADNFIKENEKYMPDPLRIDNYKINVSKIMLNLTDSCNLQCQYCYADKYYHDQKTTPALIEKIVKKFFLSDAVESVKRVVFFGGEPLLNLQGLEYFINRLEELKAQGKILELPIFNIITNGTIYNDRIGELFQKYNMGIIVSCDGPPDLQNMQRPFRNRHQGSYEVVAGNIKKMLDDGLPIGIECTVTKLAIERGYSHASLRTFFKIEFGLEEIMFVQENITNPAKAFDYSDFHDQENLYFRVLENLDFNSDAFEVPYRLISRSPLAYACGLGRTSFHILANGDIYPCQLISGKKEFQIAHIDSFNDSLFINNTWTEIYLENSTKCDLCWAKPLCKFCPARQILEKNSFVLPEPECDRNRQLLKDLIINMVKLRKDPKRWTDLLGRLKKDAKNIDQKIENHQAAI